MATQAQDASASAATQQQPQQVAAPTGQQQPQQVAAPTGQQQPQPQPQPQQAGVAPVQGAPGQAPQYPTAAVQGGPGAPTGANAAGATPAVSLYVGDLDPAVTENDLYSLFSPIGPVFNVRVCRDQITRTSLGYGYVNFAKAEDANRALDDLNFEALRGRPIRLMPVQRDPQKRRTGLGNIFISNLPESTTSVHLRDTFEQFGKILSCKAVIDNRTGNCRGFGFVHFDNPQVAERAIREANGKDIGGRKLRVAPFKPRKLREKEQEERAKNFTNIYVKSLRRGMDKEELDKLFEPYGEITSSILKEYKIDDMARPYGFVNFAKTDSAQKCVEEGEMHQREILYVDDMPFADGNPDDFIKAVEECAGKVARHHLRVTDGKLAGFVLFEDRKNDVADKCVSELPQKLEAAEGHLSRAKLYVQRAQKRKERMRRLRRKAQERRRQLREQGGNLYVKGFNEAVTEEDLRQFFKDCGHVESVKVMRDKEGMSRCFGFVTFATREEAETAVARKNKQKLKERPLYVAFHLTRQERLMRRQQQQNQQPQQGMIMYPQYTAMPGMAPFPQAYYNPQMMYQQMRPMGFPPQAAAAAARNPAGNRYMMQGQQVPQQQQPQQQQPPQQQQQAQAQAQPQQGRGMQPQGSQPQQMNRNQQQMRAFQGQQGQQAPVQGQMAPQQPQQQGQMAPQQRTPSDLSQTLASMNRDARRRYLGDLLYHRVVALDQSRAPKITGMLLEYDDSHILTILENETALRDQVTLAQNVLSNQGGKLPPMQQQQAQQQQGQANQQQQQAQQPAQQQGQQAQGNQQQAQQ